VKFTVVVTYDPEGRVYSASVPALPGCHTWGRTRNQAFANSLDAISTYIEALRKLGKPIPREVEQRVATVG
jgi:predicted RNase H-like HicB family nuclease